MLVRYSYTNKKVKQQIDEAVGKSYSLLQRLKMNGNGSQRFSVISVNDEIIRILSSKSTSDPYINIELRPNGIIVHFRVRLDNWALVLPYHTLSIFSQDNQLNLYSGEWKLQLGPYRKAPLRRDFIQKVLQLKAECQQPIG